MKKLALIFMAAATLSGCTIIPTLPEPGVQQPPRKPPAVAPSKVDLLLKEANRLADEVKAGRLSRTAAADQLNAYRLRAAGPNLVDDNTFATYRYIAVERDAGRMSPTEAQDKMDAKLREWLRAWPRLRQKPADPAFTNFLLKVYRLPPLGY
ncbi:hypothetical protein [Pseudogulbenkiania sp. MAI-1]|uniref:hypothetical protein n=1 Tax=Pseudogulbenkiania sp. MAI-1 TaxID=990370 RepID=UPI00045E7C4F|nr:hypothetical protein [Pseudogulbenkiania sp. MAI-1]